VVRLFERRLLGEFEVESVDSAGRAGGDPSTSSGDDGVEVSRLDVEESAERRHGPAVGDKRLEAAGGVGVVDVGAVGQVEFDR
jgi:hypothetical protein